VKAPTRTAVCIALLAALFTVSTLAQVKGVWYDTRDSGYFWYNSNCTLTHDPTTGYGDSMSLMFFRETGGWPAGGIQGVESGSITKTDIDLSKGWVQFWYKTDQYTRGWRIEIGFWNGSGITPVLSNYTQTACINDGQWHQLIVSNLVPMEPGYSAAAAGQTFERVNFVPTGIFGGFWQAHTVHVDRVELYVIPEPASVMLAVLGALLFVRRR